MVECAHFGESMPPMKTHRIGVWGTQTHFGRDWPPTLLSGFDDTCVQLRADLAVAAGLSNSDPIHIEKAVVLLVEPRIVEARVPGPRVKAENETDKHVSIEGTEWKVCKGEQVGKRRLRVCR